jgi:hypothetical protein
VTADDRMMYLAAQEREAAAKAYRPPAAEDTRDHNTEIMSAHGCQPSPEAAVARGVTPSSGG